jgi:hypothetical protein
MIQNKSEIDWFRVEKYTQLWLIESEYNKNQNIFIEGSVFIQLLYDQHRYYTAFLFVIALFRYIENKGLKNIYFEMIDFNIKFIINKSIVQFKSNYKKNNSLIQTVTNIPFFEYSRNCLKIAELISIGILYDYHKDYEQDLIDLIEKEPGVTHYLSENYMISFYLVSLALIKIKKIDLLRKFIINSVVFLCDQYDELGLAVVGANSVQEEEQLLSYFLEGFKFNTNKSSIIASAILYIVYKVFDEELYHKISNEYKAVDIILNYIRLLTRI